MRRDDENHSVTMHIVEVMVWLIVLLALTFVLGRCSVASAETVYSAPDGLTAVRDGERVTLAWPSDEELFEYAPRVIELNSGATLVERGDIMVYYAAPTVTLALPASDNPFQVDLFGRRCKSCGWDLVDSLYLYVPTDAEDASPGWRCEVRDVSDAPWFLGLAVSNAADQDAEGLLRGVGPGVDRAVTVRVPARSVVQGSAWELLGDLSGVELLIWTSARLRLEAILWLVDAEAGTVRDPTPFAACERAVIEEAAR